jgi:hypothetical protein
MVHPLGTLNTSLSTIQPLRHAGLTIPEIYFGAKVFHAVQSDFGFSYTRLIRPIIVGEGLGRSGTRSKT